MNDPPQAESEFTSSYTLWSKIWVQILILSF